MKIDPTKMTTDEIRDWLAERKGWKLRDDFTWHLNSYTSQMGFHPIPATLDAAAAAMPEGWSYTSVWSADNDWRCNAVRASDWKTAHGSGYTEILARFRLAALCILAEEKDQ